MADVVLSSALARKISARGITPEWPAQYNESAWTGTGRIVLLPGIEKHRFSISFRPLTTETEIREARAFFYGLKGIVNTFKLPYLPTPQAGGATSVTAGGVVGTRTVTVTSAAAISPGMPISVSLPSGHERPFVVISKAGNVLTVEPAFSESAVVGATVTISNPVCRVRLTDPRFTYSDEMGRAGFSVDVVEAIDPTPSVGGNVPVNTVAPLVSGTTSVGSLLSTTNGTWTNSPTGYTYQWQRNGVDIAGATASTYTLVSGDIGANIRVVVTASNAFGSSVPANSNSVGPVTGTTTDVVLMIGESNVAGARNRADELPLGFYATDANANVWDDADLLGSGQAIRNLKAPYWANATVTIASPAVFTMNGHGFANGDPVVPFTTGALPTGLTAGTRYWVINQTANTFQVAATRGGAAINTSGSQSGTHTIVGNAGHEQQPGGLAYVDPAFPANVGTAYQFLKAYRTVSANRVDFFFSHQGGGRFSDAASRGRAANYDETLTDGAYNEMKVSWDAYVAALAAQGRTPNIILCRINLGVNTGSNGTESGNFQTDMNQFIAQLRTDIIGNAKVVIDRLSSLKVVTNSATIRTAQQNVVAADPTRVELMDQDGLPPTTFDNIHDLAASQASIGFRAACHASALWYPAKPVQEMGDPIYPVRQYQMGGPNSSLGAGPTITAVPDIINGGNSLSPGSAPSLTTTTLANTWQRREATFNGSSNYLLGAGSPPCLPRSGGFILWGAMKAPAVNNSVLYAEGHDSLANPFWGLKSDASGNMCITLRDDSGAVPLSLSDLGVGTLFDNAWHFFALVYTGGTFTGYKDGTTGSTPRSWTPAAITLGNYLVGAQKVGGSVSGFMGAVIGELNIDNYSATGLATFLANARAYCQRFYGTP